ncbi:hypothetical protein AQUCO_00201235v1 [Aquilegia coerulea]|uniref:Serine aminopeptidase S33 domain-containing protein n=1 Tax=Aquilegia coerulea TaxID=218851 RepID=A0A2G5F700_AQUCA|nr:hypothetical protein AQUCO_00201235v1 [Aquilegia coerulea]
MIPLRQLSKTPFSIIPYKSSNVVKQRLNEVSLCKKLTSMMLNSKLVKSNSRISSKSSVLLSNAFELLLSLPFKRLKKREDSVFRVSAALKSDFGVVRDLDVGTRRAIAIQRVLEDKYDGNSVRDYFLFPTSRGDQLFIQSWTPVSVDTKGLVVLLHGLNEHSGRYNNFAKQLNANGYKVYGMDWIGHGGSDGLHAYVHSLDAAVSDMKSFLEKVSIENPGLPCFCFGHSTGAGIILKAHFPVEHAEGGNGPNHGNFG